jgi:hypothetical protein
MKRLALVFTLSSTALFSTTASAQSMSKADLRDIDELAAKLEDCSKELHAEFHEHLEHVRHGEKLEQDVSAMEKIAARLHAFAHEADGTDQSLLQIRRDTNDLLQLSSQIGRTISLAERWVRTNDGRRGIAHMRSAAADVSRAALAVDSYFPVDTQVIDGQADRLEKAVKELHSEFHEHLEGYEVSQHLDEDLEKLERTVEHMHGLAHEKTWEQIDFRHLLEDIREVKEFTTHIESLFVRQSRIGVLTRDYIGIEHSRDAITDVLSSAFLLEHMIRKSDPRARSPIDHGLRTERQRPRRDRIGYGVDDRYTRDLYRHETRRPNLRDYDLRNYNLHGYDLHRNLHDYDLHNLHRDLYRHD